MSKPKHTCPAAYTLAEFKKQRKPIPFWKDPQFMAMIQRRLKLFRNEKEERKG